MRLRIALFLAFLTLPVAGRAQTPAPAPSGMPSLAGITVGESLASIRQRMGDPLRADTFGENTIWRYLSGDGAVYVDVLARNNVALSPTVVARFGQSPYTAPSGAAFGMSRERVRSLLGNPARTTTNADDGSIDFWYGNGDEIWIYEFHADRLDFVQLELTKDVQATLGRGPAVDLGDGSSPARAIRPVVADALAAANWVGAYLRINRCGQNGHWIDRGGAPGLSGGFEVVHASCSDGSSQRDFYFDTSGWLRGLASRASGSATMVAPGSSQTIYVDASTLETGTPAASPQPQRGGTSFADAVVITASSEDAGVAAEYAYVAKQACGSGGTWKVAGQSLVRDAGTPYDVLRAVCSQGGQTRSFFFDIGSFYGKP